MAPYTPTSLPELYPVKLIDHGSPFAGVLYDVEGKIIRGRTGRPLNVFQQDMAEALVDGSLLIRYCLHDEYRYFITSDMQLDDFLREREEGSERKNKAFHVYVDDDVNRMSSHYRSNFIRYRTRRQ